MKEIRPATWIAFIVMGLLIFVPAFFIDSDMFVNKREEFEQKHTTPPRPNTPGPQKPDANNPGENTPAKNRAPRD